MGQIMGETTSKISDKKHVSGNRIIRQSDVFGDLLVIQQHGPETFCCKCACGNYTIVAQKDLLSGNVDECLNCDKLNGRIGGRFNCGGFEVMEWQ